MSQKVIPSTSTTAATRKVKPSAVTGQQQSNEVTRKTRSSNRKVSKTVNAESVTKGNYSIRHKQGRRQGGVSLPQAGESWKKQRVPYGPDFFQNFENI